MMRIFGKASIGGAVAFLLWGGQVAWAQLPAEEMPPLPGAVFETEAPLPQSVDFNKEAPEVTEATSAPQPQPRKTFRVKERHATEVMPGDTSPAAKGVETEEVKPAEGKPAEVRSAQVRTTEDKPAGVRSAQVRTTEDNPTGVRSAQVRTTKAEAATVQPTESSSSAVVPTESKPAPEASVSAQESSATVVRPRGTHAASSMRGYVAKPAKAQSQPNAAQASNITPVSVPRVVKRNYGETVTSIVAEEMRHTK